MSFLKTFTNGIVKENPLLVLSIGLCSSLAVTTSVFNGLGMGLSMTFVLLMSEIIISLFRKLIPGAIRLPIFIIVIAAFTTIVQLLLQAYLPALSDALGVFIPLIVVNCIIMGRVEAFSSKNSVAASILDALGMGVGYTWVLVAISVVRELLGSGKLLGFEIFSEEKAIGFFTGAPGGFFVFGIMIAVTLGLSEMKKTKKPEASKKAADGQENASGESAGGDK